MNGIALIVAAGEGRRLGCGPKAFIELAGRPLLRWAAEAAAGAQAVDGIVAAVPPGAEERAAVVLDGLRARCEVVPGGDSRQASVACALRAAAGADVVAVHDAARPLCPAALFDRCIVALEHADASLAGVPVTDTIKEVGGGLVRSTLDRSRLVAAQTPQAFRAGLLRAAHERAASDGVEATDDAALVERLGVGIRLVEGDERNIKITTPADLARAEALLGTGTQ